MVDIRLKKKESGPWLALFLYNRKRERKLVDEKDNSIAPLYFLIAGCTEAIKPEKMAVTAGHDMRVHFIDVGQGDSILIESPNGKTMLVDGGVKGAGQQIVSYLKELGVSKLDVVVATHPDADHIGGLIPVLNSLTIEQFYDSGKVHTSQTFEEMLTLIDEKISLIMCQKQVKLLSLIRM